MRRRLLAFTALSAAVGLAALVGADRLAAGRIEDGVWAGWLQVPPFGAPDAAARGYVEARIAQLERGEDDADYRAFDLELGWTNRPGVGGEGDRTHFGPLGTRGPREYAPAPPPGTLRVAAFGDSFLHAEEVSDEECWSAVLEALEPRVEVLNFGVSAYGTDQALLRFRRQGLHGAEVAVLGLLLENIGRNVNRFRPLYVTSERYPSVKPRFVLQDGALELLPVPFESEVEFLRAALDGTAAGRCAEHEYWTDGTPLLSCSAIARVLAGRAARADRDHRPLWTERGEPYELTRALVERFDAEARAAGARRVLVLVFGTRSDVDGLGETPPDRYWQPLLDDLEARSIAWIDVASGLAAEAGGTERTFARHHLNAAGNRYVAERVRAWLLADAPGARPR